MDYYRNFNRSFNNITFVILLLLNCIVLFVSCRENTGKSYPHYLKMKFSCVDNDTVLLGVYILDTNFVIQKSIEMGQNGDTLLVENFEYDGKRILQINSICPYDSTNNKVVIFSYKSDTLVEKLEYYLSPYKLREKTSYSYSNGQKKVYSTDNITYRGTSIFDLNDSLIYYDYVEIKPNLSDDTLFCGTISYEKIGGKKRIVDIYKYQNLDIDTSVVEEYFNGDRLLIRKDYKRIMRKDIKHTPKMIEYKYDSIGMLTHKREVYSDQFDCATEFEYNKLGQIMSINTCNTTWFFTYERRE